MANAFDGPGISAANFPTLAINLYNDVTGLPLPPQLHNKHRVKSHTPGRMHHLRHNETVVVETNEDLYLGRLDLSMTNGFRFGNAILSANEVSADQTFSDGREAGEITLRDLFALFPISPGVGVAEFSGARIKSDLEVVLSAVFNRNPFLQRGGWYVGLANMTQKIDLDNRPFSSSGGRIVDTTVGGMKLDTSKRYRFASCFPHGEAVDRICRTSGGVNHLFFELADADDYSSSISLVPAVNSESIITGPQVKQVLPDRFVHPVHMMRRYLDSLPGRTVTAADAVTDRIQTLDSTIAGNQAVPAPISEIDPTGNHGIPRYAFLDPRDIEGTSQRA